MKLVLNEAKIQHTIRKNTATSYGLTLVAGLPFPPEIGDRVQRTQERLDALAPGRFTWYGLDHLHATLLAPLRGRYRDSPPLQRSELPTDLQGFVQDLADFFAQHQLFSLELVGVHVTAEGFVMVGENTLMQQLASNLRRYPNLDPPKRLQGLHVAIGFLTTEQPFATDEEQVRFEMTLAQLMEAPIGRVVVQHVWLVHYANRTLNRIVGKVPFTLGRANSITVEHLLHELGIPAE